MQQLLQKSWQWKSEEGERLDLYSSQWGWSVNLNQQSKLKGETAAGILVILV